MTTATAEKAIKLPDLHEKTTAHSDAFAKELTVDVKAKRIEIASDIYERLLPEDLTIAQCRAVHDYEAHLVAGFVDAVATKALESASKHKTLDVVTASLPMAGRNRMDVTWTREVERNAGLPKEGEPTVKKTVYGTIVPKAIVTGFDGSIGELNKVGKRQKAAAMAMFGAK